MQNSPQPASAENFYLLRGAEHHFASALQLVDLAGRQHLTLSEHTFAKELAVNLGTAKQSLQLLQNAWSENAKYAVDVLTCESLWQKDLEGLKIGSPCRSESSLQIAKLNTANDQQQLVKCVADFFTSHQIAHTFLGSVERDTEIQEWLKTKVRFVDSVLFEQPFFGTFWPPYELPSCNDLRPALWHHPVKHHHLNSIPTLSAAYCCEFVHEWAHLTLACAAQRSGVSELEIPPYQREAFAIFVEALWQAQTNQNLENVLQDICLYLGHSKRSLREHRAGYGFLKRWLETKRQGPLIIFPKIS